MDLKPTTPTKKPLVPRNLATWDRILRVVIALGLLGYWAANGFQGFLWPILAGALLVNAAMGSCGAYALFGLSTCHIEEPPPPEKGNLP